MAEEPQAAEEKPAKETKPEEAKSAEEAEEASTSEEQPGEEAETPADTGRRKMLFLVVGSGVVLGCVLLGAFLLFFSGKHDGKGAGEEEHQKAKPKPAARYIFNLGRSIVGNLLPGPDGKRRHIKVNFSLRCSSKAVKEYLDSDDSRAIASGFIINKLNSLSLEDLNREGGDTQLARELVELFNTKLLRPDYFTEESGERGYVLELYWKNYLIE